MATNDISFTMDRHEVIGLIGPNGAGKTTLLRLIMGILKPDSGSIRYNGTDISGRKTWDIVNMGIACYVSKHATFSQIAHHRQRDGILPVSSCHEEGRMGEADRSQGHGCSGICRYFRHGARKGFHIISGRS